jgi:hypothetical protein
MRKQFEIILLGCFIFAIRCGEVGQCDRTHSDLKFWRVGNMDGIVQRFGMDIYAPLANLDKYKEDLDQFLFALANRPLTENQILKRRGQSRDRVYYFIYVLDSINLLQKDNQNRWETTVPVITDKQMIIIRRDITPMAIRVAETIRKGASLLESLYNKVKSTSDPAWGIVSHLILDKLLIDGSFHRNLGLLERENGYKKYYSEDQKAIPAYFIEQGKNFANFGTNWYRFEEKENQREIYVLHGSVLNRTTILMNRFRGNEHFTSALFKIPSDGNMKALNKNEKEMFQYLNWSSEERLLVPMVQANTIIPLLPLIGRIGKEAAETAFEDFSPILDSFDKSSYSKFLDGAGDYFQVCYHTLFCVIIEQLISMKVLPEIPDPVPDHFGAYITIGNVWD